MYGDLKNTSHNAIENEEKKDMYRLVDQGGHRNNEDLNRPADHGRYRNNHYLNRPADHGGYLRIFAFALKSAPDIRELFAGRTLQQMEVHHREVLTSPIHLDHLPKLLEVELDLMYDDIYTKAMVLWTRSGILFRVVCLYNRDEPTMAAMDWPKLCPLLDKLLPDYGASFGYAIVCFHIFTEIHLRSRSFLDLSYQDKILVSACQKLSNYMLYLLVTYPEMLPKTIQRVSDGGASADILPVVKKLLVELGLPQVNLTDTETLKEMRDLWTRLLIYYCAGKSRAHMHAAKLSRGGELITFAWLLMAHKELGDVGRPFNFSFASTPGTTALACPPPTSPQSLPFITVAPGVTAQLSPHINPNASTTLPSVVDVYP
uniref:DUF4220 domain-containing protein n=1 Tax=Aegilops tauschii TaxID=37682 RepID=M8BXB1_AEGTA